MHISPQEKPPGRQGTGCRLATLAGYEIIMDDG